MRQELFLVTAGGGALSTSKLDFYMSVLMHSVRRGVHAEVSLCRCVRVFVCAESCDTCMSG